MIWLHPVVHEAACALRFIGLRDRLRCPRCEAVGTWKPHGDWWSQRKGDRAARRWLCKWCGLYIGPEGVRQGFISNEHKTWRIADDTPGRPHYTPRYEMRKTRIRRAWPWRG